MRLSVVVPTMRDFDGGSIREQFNLFGPDVEICIVRNSPKENRGVLKSYQDGLEWTQREVIAFIHDDVEIYEQWVHRVLKEFDDPSVGVVGFGGGLNHGTDDIYKTPYRLQQLARDKYLSNVNDAEVHGTRFTGEHDVAVLDGFSLIVRRELLIRAGGWPYSYYPPHHCYDYWVCCRAHQLGYRVRVVGVKCHHFGGRTATSSQYQEWTRGTKWGSDVNMHSLGHRLIYDEFRDVLPYRVPWTGSLEGGK